MNISYGNQSRRQVIQQPQQQTHLSWSTLQNDILLTGETDINSLKNIKNTILAIRRQFETNNDPKIHLNPLDRDDFSKRMILIQNQVQGLMRRKINMSTSNDQGQRSLDYTMLLNEKQNQIIQLEKKIQNIQYQLRKASARQIQLQNHIVYLNDELRVKEQIILSKNEVILSEVANSNTIREALNKIRRNVQLNKHRIQDLDRIVLSQVNIPDIGSFEIKPQMLTRTGALSRSRTYQQLSVSQQLKTKIIEMFRQVQRILNQSGDITQNQFQGILQGFVLSQKQSRIFQKSMIAAKRANIEEKYQHLRQNFAIAAGIYNQNIQKLKKDNPTIKINFQKNLFQILQRENVKAYQVQSGAIYIDAYTQKTIQVPVQDARTKHLIHLLATQMKKFTTKYPQILKEMDSKLCQFFQQQIIECIQVDQMDRLVSIVKYVPQVVKVQNVYAYSSQKTRKVQFHLRVLIKALLQQLQKIKRKTGVILQMDEGILNMISAQIMGVINVDDILKIFRPVPKIVEVQKIIEKIVQRRVQVPMCIPISKEVEKIIEVEKIVEVERIVYVPLQIPVVHLQLVDRIVPLQQIIERIIEVPTIVERIVYVIQQVPKIVQVPTVIERIVQVQKIVQVQRVVNHIQQQVQQVQIIREKIVPVQTIIEKIVQVPVIKQKIVQRIVEVPKIQIIQRIVQKVVPMIQYRKALQISNHIETIHKPVDRIIQKIVPVIKIVQRIVQVPQVIEKIVEVIVEKIQFKQIQVIRQKLIKQQVIKIVEVPVTTIVTLIKEVPVQVQKYIQIPLIHEVVKRVQQIVQKPIIERVQTTIYKQVYLRDPMILYEPKIVEVEKIINHYIEVPKPVRYIEEKIIQIPRNVERIKQVRVEIDKIIEKMVEVPKVIQVERIVEKVVVVPRVIQKIVQVPKIVEKLVEKIVQRIVVKEVERVVQVPVIQQKIVQVQVIKNVYVQIQKPVDRFVDKLVTINNIQQKVITQEVKVQNIVEVIRQVPKTMYVDKIVPAYFQQVKPIEIQKIQIVPHEIAVPVEVVVEKYLPYRQVVEKIIQVPQFIQKIVQVKEEKIKIEEIQKIIEKIVVDQRVKQVYKQVPYIQEVIKEIPTIVEKIVTVQSKVQQIITAQQIVQKIVERSTTIPRIYEVEKVVSKIIKIPQIIEIQKIIPQVIKVNQYIQRIVEKVVQVPRIIERIKQIQIEKQRVVQARHTIQEIVQVEKVVEKIAILEQMKEVIKNVNHIQKVIEIVQKIQRAPIQIAVKQQILVEIPYIIQKIVQKIVVMPQVVEVLRYVRQIAQSNELLAVQNQQQFKNHQFKFIQITKNMKPALDGLIRQLRTLKNLSQVSGKVQIIEAFLIQLDKLIAFPKLIKIKDKQRTEERIIQKQKIVKVPVQDEHQLRKQISMSMLIQKLVMEVKRMMNKTGISSQLDDQIKMIFFTQLQISNRYSIQGQLKDKLNRFTAQINRKFESLGPWAYENQLMLNTILQQRFKLAQIIESANIEIERSKQQLQGALVILNQQTSSNKNCLQMLNRLKNIYKSYSTQKQSQISQIKKFIDDVQIMQREIDLMRSQHIPYITMNQSSGFVNQNLQSKVREKQATIFKLKENIYQLQQKQLDKKSDVSFSKYNSEYIRSLEKQIQDLRRSKYMHDTRVDLSKLQDSYKRDIANIQQRNEFLERQNSDLKTALQNSNRQLRTLHQNQKFLMRRDESHRVQDSYSVRRGSGHYSISQLSHSQIKRLEDNSLSKSQFISQYEYGGRTQDPRQSPSTYLRYQRQTIEHPIGQMTPLQKYRSPQATGVKYTQSFIKQESQSLLGQTPPKMFTPSSGKHEQEKKQAQKSSETGNEKQYRYYFSPEDRGKP